MKLEGNDDRVTAATLGAAGLDQVNEIIRNPVIEIQLLNAEGAPEVVKCPITPKAGGDQAFQGSFLCIKSCNTSHPCPYCEVSLVDMCCTDLEKVKRFVRRTQERTELMAHSRCGTCPACNQIITEANLAKEVAHTI
jgi:hypothetical protein